VETAQSFELLEEAIALVRTARVLLNYTPGQQIQFYVSHEEPKRKQQLTHLSNYLVHLGRGTAELAPTAQWPTAQLLRLVSEGLSVGVAVADDVDVKKALDRIVKQRSEQAKEIERLDSKLRNSDFVAKAPPEVIADHQERVRKLQHDQAVLASSEKQLRTMSGA